MSDKILEVITPKQIYKLVSEVCDLLNKHNISYLVYGSVALNLLNNQENEIHDIDIMVMRSDLDKIKNILPNSFNPIQTEFSIHANSKEYIGSNGKPFDVSFDSYDHYFKRYGISLNKSEKIDLEGAVIKLMPKKMLKMIYEIYSQNTNTVG